MKRILLTALLSGLVSVGAFSQQPENEGAPCLSTEKTQELFDLYPGLEDRYYQYKLLQNSAVYSSNPEAKSDSVKYVIPVVFHILHQYGVENISDAQVYDAMRVINEEFNALDPDSVNIIDPYKDKNADANIEFKLASVDPYGNCTNGIEHIYTHETLIGDDFSKLHQWDRSHYLNIWVSQVIGSAGAAAYAFKPPATDGFGFWRDGIIANQSYVGSIGTSAPWKEHVLTHEIGHYLSLDHVWGGTNDPGVACGDDGVLDTPVTKGYSSCVTDTTQLKDCDSTIIEDINNYMEYSYCNYHFTDGQVAFMHNALEGISGQRNILWQDSTLAITGVDVITVMPQTALTVPLCAPIADFSVSETRICQGTSVTFSDASWNAVIDNWAWEFQDGTPATSTNQNPVVTFSSPGWKTVSLTVSNATGSDTKTMNSYIYVSPEWADFTGPAALNIEGTQNYLFLVENPENNYAKFDAVSGVGYDGSKAFKLNVYKDITNADPFTADAFYNDRLGKTKDYLVTPSFDLRNTTNVTVGFWYSYASNASQVNDITEVLKVFSSRNCGESWVTRKTIQGASLVTGGFAGNLDYTPTNNGMWEYAEFTYTPTSSDNRTRFMFEFEASDLSSNLYIDNININGTLSVVAGEIADLALVVYPNPSKGEAINVQFNGQDNPVTFTLRDMAGKVITTEVVEKTNGTVDHEISGTSGLPSACYFLEVKSGDYTTTKKVVIL